MKKLFLHTLTFLTLFTTLSASEKPNIILIFADDVGYGDLGCYGAPVKTPNIDTLAKTGIHSTDCLVASSVCGPSRAALMTGRYPMRAGHPISRHNTEKYKNYGIHPQEITIPELLKSAGYYNKIVGKWHLGFHVKGSHPLDAGFHDYLGIHGNHSTKHGDADTLYHNHQVKEEKIPMTKLTKLYTDEVVNFIHQKHQQPFFIYFAHHIAHTPVLPSKPFKGTSGKKGPNGNYSDFILELDHSVGRLHKAVEEAGIANNTLIIFLSDNGPARFGSAKPLSGGKYVTMEGGMRVPAIFTWPTKIPPSQQSDAMITSMDLLPLFTHLAGAKLPDDRTIDGKNIIDILTGKTTQSPHKYFYYYNGLNLQAIRNEQWKLHFPRTAEDQPYWAKKGGGGNPKKIHTTLKSPMLFNLDTDPAEKNNLISQHPEIVTELTKQATHIRKEIGDIHTTGTHQRPHGLVNPNNKD
ncbi:MAG: sulfatase family protein [Akkermansiaceae bacterium]